MSDRSHGSRRVWLSRVTRIVVCAIAIAYLYTKVSWFDYARLSAEPDHPLRVVSPPGVEPFVLEDPKTGARREVAGGELTSMKTQREPPRPAIEPGLRNAVTRMRLDWALWALAALAPTTFLLGWRLRDLMAMQGISIAYWEAVALTFAGNFFNFTLPGTTGGDIYKAYHIAKHAHKRTEAVAVVFIDRAIGLINYILLAALCIAIPWRRQPLGPLGKIVGLLLLGLIVGAMIYFSRRFRRWIRYDALLARLPLADKLRRIDQTAFSFRYHPRQTILALLITTLNNGLLALCVMCLGCAVGMPRFESSPSAIDFAQFYLASMMALSTGFLLAAVPISVQGFGLLETVFLRVLGHHTWGTDTQVIAVCLGIRVAQLIWAVPGVIVPWLGLRRPPVQEAEALANEEMSLVTDESAGAGSPPAGG